MCEYEYLCPICLEVITEAVWLVDTRQLYDRGCLIKWLDRGARPCPHASHCSHDLAALCALGAPVALGT